MNNNTLSDKKTFNDLKPFEHGEEGTHFACPEMIEKLGDKVRCCGCNKHNCKPSPSVSEESSKIIEENLNKYSKAWETLASVSEQKECPLHSQDTEIDPELNCTCSSQPLQEGVQGTENSVGWEKEFDDEFTYKDDLGDLEWDKKWKNANPENVKAFIIKEKQASYLKGSKDINKVAMEQSAQEEKQRTAEEILKSFKANPKCLTCIDNMAISETIKSKHLKNK